MGYFKVVKQAQIGTIIDSTKDYQLVVLGDATGTGQYAIQHKKYGVAEALTPLLPQALEFLGQIQEALDKRRNGAILEEAEGLSSSTDGVLKD